MTPTTPLICNGCGEPFDKPTNEVTRQRKANPNRKFFCTSSCYGKNEVALENRNPLGNTRTLRAGNRQDDFSSFRYFMRKARNRRYETDLDLPYLKALWESQEGRCALSGIAMKMPRNTSAWEKDTGNPWKPSLDRKDSSRGYLRGNVRFVTVIANFCKQGFTDEQVHTFCQAVAAHTL